MSISRANAMATLNDAHSAWSEGDLDGTLACYTDDLKYVCDTGGYDGGPLVVVGKEQFRDFLRPVIEVVSSASVVRHFVLAGDVGHGFVDCDLHHRTTDRKLVGTYTQIARYRAGKICQLFEIHDIARMADFWRLVLSEEETPAAAIIRARQLRSMSWTKQLPKNWYGKDEASD